MKASIGLRQRTRLLRRNGQSYAFGSVVQDITERKQAEKTLQESEERFRSLYENSTIGIYRTTPEGKLF